MLAFRSIRVQVRFFFSNTFTRIQCNPKRVKVMQIYLFVSIFYALFKNKKKNVYLRNAHHLRSQLKEQVR